MRKDYTRPDILVVQVKTKHRLLAGSIKETTGSAAEMSTGSFNSRGYDDYWDDEDCWDE